MSPEGDGADAPKREAFLINDRMRLGSRVAIVAAVLCMVGLVGAVASGTDPHKESAFDLARKETSFEIKAYRPGPGYLVGPVLILITIVPLVWRKSAEGRRVASSVLYKDEYRVRLGLATALWVGGLAAAIIAAAVLSSDDYTIKGGTFIALALISLGLLGTLAMWPFGTRAVHVDEAGNVSE